MELSIYEVIRKPIITDKASQLARKLNKIVLEVHMMANKPLIKEALEKLFNVKVKNIRINVRKGKSRKFKRVISVGSDSKRAIVTLKPGYSLEMADNNGRVENVPSEVQKSSE